MKDNPLLQLQTLGQSIWLDYIRRSMIESGELKRLIDEDGLRGVTSNPSIFEKAIAGSRDYDDEIRELTQRGWTAERIYQALTVADIQRAADAFRPLYDASAGEHGFVSLEVNPHLARDTQGTLEEARLLWTALDRPNVFVKVPATIEGLPAIEQLIAEGINVNVTLLFGLPRYRQVAEAFVAGLERRAANGLPLTGVASVASFFLSRIDVLVDHLLEERMSAAGLQADLAERLRGQVAIASARMAYQIYKEVFEGDRFTMLADQGARPQRVLWASTSTKNPDYSDVKYVEPLIGPQTINTLPQETLRAYRDHGEPALRLEEDPDQAAQILELVLEAGLDLDALTQQLEDEGLEKFNKPYDSTMEVLAQKQAEARSNLLKKQTLALGRYDELVRGRLTALEEMEFSRRLWDKDPGLWTEEPREQEKVRNALGWLRVSEKMESELQALREFAAEVRAAGFHHVVHMGMGGSSLAPLTFQQTFVVGENGLPFTVLDTTDPTTIRSLEKRLPLKQTLFIVASKSGTTAEVAAFCDYFYDRVKAAKGNRAGENFVAITDPDTPLVEQAEKRGFRQVFVNFTDIGGRYSALSFFGLVPAALMGLDVERILEGALLMQQACEFCVPVQQNPGVILGVVLAELAGQGRDKVTMLLPEPLAALGMWLEQLLAESTGKAGKGLVPVAGEPPGDPSVYGADRLFVYYRLQGATDDLLEKGAAALQDAGHPVVVIEMSDRLDLGSEFLRWEIATATAGAVMGINAFDQPNVQESKDNTNRLLNRFSEEGRLPSEEPVLQQGPLIVYADRSAAGLEQALADFLGSRKPGDYIALLAYLTEDEPTSEHLARIRLFLRDRLNSATTIGYGPRYLHSTGQLHKGGPDTGVFLELTAEDPDDMPVPERPYSFGILKQAQAQGDLEALRKYGRRVLRIHITGDIPSGLKRLYEAMRTALA